MPHLSPIIWNIIFAMVWISLTLLVLFFETKQHSLSRN